MTRRRLTSMRPATWIVLVMLAAICLAFPVGGAYAWFSASGAGTGSATAGTMQPVTIDTSSASPASALLPGDAADVVLTVSNPNDFAVVVVGVENVPDEAVSVTGAAGCTADNAWVSFLDQTGLEIPVPAHATGQVVHLTDAAVMSITSDNACQGAAFSFPVTVTAQST